MLLAECASRLENAKHLAMAWVVIVGGTMNGATLYNVTSPGSEISCTLLFTAALSQITNPSSVHRTAGPINSIATRGSRAHVLLIRDVTTSVPCLVLLLDFWCFARYHRSKAVLRCDCKKTLTVSSWRRPAMQTTRFQ